MKEKKEKDTTWFSRWRKKPDGTKGYPGSIIGHMAQGVAAGVLAAYGYHWAAGIWTAGYFSYQFGSGARKAINKRKADTIGLDAFDFTIGFVPAYLVAKAVRHMVE